MELKVAEIAGLYVYPIKSCKGVSVDRAALTSLGLGHDRRFMLVDAKGMLLSQRDYPRLCLVQPEIMKNGLNLLAPRMPCMSVSLEHAYEERRVITVRDDQCIGFDVGDPVAGWFSQFIDRECRLMVYSERVRHSSYFQQDIPVSFADGYPLLGISQQSLENLNSRIVESGGTPVFMNRFRPNIVFRLKENERPYAEEKWRWDALFIGDENVRLKTGPACVRCGVVSINQETGDRDPNQEPLRTLAQYKKGSKGVFFGRYFMKDTTQEDAVLCVGDTVKLFRAE